MYLQPIVIFGNDKETGTYYFFAYNVNSLSLSAQKNCRELYFSFTSESVCGQAELIYN